MASLNLPDPDVLYKWGEKIGGLLIRTWNSVTRRESRACRRLLVKSDLLVDNIWPYLSSGSARMDSLRCVIEDLFRNSTGEDQKVRSKVLDRFRDLGEWLSFLHIRLKKSLLVKPTRIGLLYAIVEINTVLSRMENVMEEFELNNLALASPLKELRQNYAKFRDTYNHFLTEYEALCRDARAVFREIQEPSFKRLE